MSGHTWFHYALAPFRPRLTRWYRRFIHTLIRSYSFHGFLTFERFGHLLGRAPTGAVELLDSCVAHWPASQE